MKDGCKSVSRGNSLGIIGSVGIFVCRIAVFFYFEDPLEAQNGYIPLINCAVKDAPDKKKWALMITLDRTVMAAGLAKRDEYLLAAESGESAEEWKRVIGRYSADWLVGQPYLAACRVTPTERHTECLIPYFVDSLLGVLGTAGLKTPAIWTYQQPPEVTSPYLFTINQNLPVACSEPHVAAGVIIAWLRSLPDSPFPSEAFPTRGGERPVVEAIAEALRYSPAPVRELMGVLGRHWKMVVASPATGVSPSQLAYLGSILLRQRGSDLLRSQFVPALIENADTLLADIHSFGTTFSGPPIARAKLSKAQFAGGGDKALLEGPMSMLIYIARVDDAGWGVCYAAGRTCVGLVHQSGWTSLSKQEAADVDAERGVDVLLSIVREKCAGCHLMFDGMVAEIAALRSALGA